MTHNHTDHITPGWIVSTIPFAVLVVSLFVVVMLFGSSSLDGASQVALLFSSAVAVAISMVFYHIPWAGMESAIADNIRTIAPAVIILLLIGAISGSWMVSGIVPTLMYYGLKILSPKIFLLAACLICAMVSLVTGSSWTTIATIGVAFMGIGSALGFSAGWTAGAIISGAYFGDKMSPLSDTTVLASSVSETPLFSHIRYMAITTTPAISLAAAIFLIKSLCYEGASEAAVADFSGSLAASFNINPWLLVVPVLTCMLIVRRVPALLTLFLSALMAGVAALVAQPEIVSSIGSSIGEPGCGDQFKGLLVSFYGDTCVDTGNETLNALVATRGMAGMLNTIFLILCAATFGGVLTGCGMIQSITDAMTRGITGRKSLVGATVTTGVFSNVVTGDQFLSIILTTSLYKRLYRDKGYESRLLSRSVEDSATVTSVLIPWNSCGMTQSTVLKVPTVDYLPYCFFNILCPVVSLSVAVLGYRIFHNGQSASCKL